jgi:beta-lactamase regulating signal transducer with metallopeptidase domain
VTLGVATSLRIASMESSFLLQSAFAWIACLITTRIVQTHRARFRVWMGFLLLFVAQWARMLIAVARPVAVDRSVTAGYTSPPPDAHRVSVMPWTANDMSTLVAIVCCGYCAIVLALVVREAASHLRLKRALRYRLAPPASLQSAFDRLVLSHGLKDCSVWLLPGLSSPATLGWWRPQVVLPPPICQSPEMEDVEAALWHELKHVQRRDALWNSLMRMCSILLWFHPSVHYASKAAVRERELACDADVIQDHPNVRDRYASCLLRFARLGSSTQNSLDRCIGMTSGSGLLELRVRAILGEVASDEGGGGVATRTAVVGMMCAAYVVTAPILSIAFNSAEPFDLNRLTSITPISMRSRVGSTGGVNAQRRSGGNSIGIAQLSAPAGPRPTAPAPGDPALAAEHRAGFNVLTGFHSEMDSSLGENTAASDPAGRGPAPRISAPSGTPRFSVPWTGMAIGAAQQLGSLSRGGRDHDHD